MTKVIKRNGNIEEFNREKIEIAIKKAFVEVDGELSDGSLSKAIEIAKFIESRDKESLEVEEIQDMVEDKLMASNRKDVARAYIRYRYDRQKDRERNNQFIKGVSEKIMASNIQNQNANVDENSFGGRMGEARSYLMKDYALNYIISDMARENHLNNEIYMHDLDS